MMFYKMVSVILWPMLQVNAFLFLCTILVVDPTNPNDEEYLEWFGFKLVGDNIDRNVKLDLAAKPHHCITFMYMQ